MIIKNIAIVGGSGFIGRHLIQHLTNQGYKCRVITRHAHRHTDIKTAATLIETNVFDRSNMLKALRGCDAVINLAGILNPNGNSFRRVHVELVEQLISTCQEAGVSRFLHMSALNADQGKGASQYLRTKGEGENRAHTLGQPHIAVTSFRPSVVFGTDDSFLNRFSQLMDVPGPMPLACPDSQFAPIHVDDLVQAIGNSIENKETFGRHIQLCGSQVFSLHQIVEMIAKHRGIKKKIIRLPDAVSRLLANILRFAPGKPFTPDNYLSLQQASVCTRSGLVELDVEATLLETGIARAFSIPDKNLRRNQLREKSAR